ncbi:EAL domain-containing protein [Frankia sp. AiPs1]|uniref:sensor domain-containing phosphodiesterase n=1 Tax=Frankia sp. AiPs1 TaxID=573493 RepID=UPI0020440206|nr:EAL domain-containing protein [Frankia sp. AiPs1]MCM3923026.1 EAL domain-containing protein [Frankia sp. AiPs1]
MARAESASEPSRGGIEPDTTVMELLGILRRHLGMDLAYLARADGEDLVIQVLNGAGGRFGLAAGARVRPDPASYRSLLAGTLPKVIPDTRCDPLLIDLPIVRRMGIGCYASAVVTDKKGEVFGVLGCISRDPRPHLRERDSRFLGLAAEYLSDAVLDLHRIWEARSRVWCSISELIDAGGPEIVYQPIVDLATGRIAAVEALSRFPGESRLPGEPRLLDEPRLPHEAREPPRGPRGWYFDATTIGLSAELELAAIRRALRALPQLPTAVCLTVNASPATIISGLLDVLHDDETCRRLIVEITEHEYFCDDAEVLRGVRDLRSRGVRIAADDTGTGYAGLEQLIELHPDIVKLDYVVTHGMDTDPARRTTAAALVMISREFGGLVIAEGIETPGELDTALDVHIPYGQGFLLGAPAATPSLACAGRTGTGRGRRPDGLRPGGSGGRAAPPAGRRATTRRR